ncbi:MAG: 50S ribosomal protein L6 [Clostridiales bacterium]|jgi:large subunit ribosomal protein L6|nr:50S ribosomal protein L6 [Clostridiales bacterium]
MSRIGNKLIEIPHGVSVCIEDNSITAKGPLGNSQKYIFHNEMIVTIIKNRITVKRLSDSKKHKSLHGTTRTALNNIIIGVYKGFRKELIINGVGYKASINGNILTLTLGFSHLVVLEIPENISVELPSPNRIVVFGISKQEVGDFAAKIRKQKPPEPYKGRGIIYSDEVIRRKVGKSGSKKKQ